MVLTLLQYWRMARLASPGTIYQRRVKLFLIAFSIIYLGSVDYLPKYGIPIYPFGYLPVFCFLVLAARVVWKYRLVDITASFAADRIIETMNEPLIVCDIKGFICVVNPAGCKTFGYSAEELVGNSVEFLTGGKTQDWARLWAFVNLGRTKDKEWIFRTKQGKEMAVSLFVSVIKDHSPFPLGYVIVARDITEHKRMAETFKTLNETLEKRVKERTEQLEAKIEELEWLNEVMMGREERILELKNEIETLKARLFETLKITA